MFPEAAGREEAWIARRLADRKRNRTRKFSGFSTAATCRSTSTAPARAAASAFAPTSRPLIQSRASFKLLFENNPVPMFVCDNETLEVVAVNQAAAAHYGYEIDTFPTKSIYDSRC